MDDPHPTESVPIDTETESVASVKYSSKAVERPSTIRSLTRLMVGGILTGMNGLSTRLLDWDNRATSSHEEVFIAQVPYPPDALLDLHSNEIPVGDLDDSREQANRDTSTDKLRYAVVGLVFDTQDRLEKSIYVAGRFTRALEHLTRPFIEPVMHSRLLTPARNQFNRLVDRGEQQVKRWVETGRREEFYSRKFANIALYETVDFWIDYFAESPEVVDLVTSQSLSFAEEVVEEVRERTVSADNFLEGLVRTVFRLPTRIELPPPPPEVQKEAQHTRRQARKV